MTLDVDVIKEAEAVVRQAQRLNRDVDEALRNAERPTEVITAENQYNDFHPLKQRDILYFSEQGIVDVLNHYLDHPYGRVLIECGGALIEYLDPISNLTSEANLNLIMEEGGSVKFHPPGVDHIKDIREFVNDEDPQQIPDILWENRVVEYGLELLPAIGRAIHGEGSLNPNTVDYLRFYLENIAAFLVAKTISFERLEQAYQSVYSHL